MQTLRIIYQTVLVILAAGLLQAQPVLVKEIPRGSTEFSVIGDLVYFRSADSLYRTDGTAEGTIFLKKALAGSFKEFNGHLYFLSPSSAGTAVWRSNGTPAGTIHLQTYDAVRFIEPAGNYLYFVASTSATGREIYRTDGTPGGTILLKDINPGPANGMPELPYFQNQSWHYFPSGFAGNLLFFAADNGTQGIELWKTNGSPAGTLMVEDINPGAGNGFVKVAPATFNNEFFFTGFTSADGAEPWVSDGSAEGTRLLTGIGPDAIGTDYVEYSIDHDGFLYFAPAVFPESPGESILQLWRTDGSEAGTSYIKDFCVDCVVHRDVLVYNDKLYYFLQRDEVVSLWGTDGSSEGTGEFFSRLIDGNIPFFDAANNLILFYTTSQGSSTTFYRSDGTSAGTTQFWGFKSGYFRNSIDLAKVNDLVFFSDHDGPDDGYGGARDPEDAFQLMQTDGFTVVSLRTLFGISFKGTANIVNYDGKVLFTTQDNDFESTDAHKRLWIYDATQQPQDTASFTLVNADTDEDIQTLAEGDLITKPAGTFFNIRYNPVGNPGSVVFKHQNKVVRIENAAPFALRGDYSGNYLRWEAGVAGSHKVEATPYSEPRGKGTAGPTLTINFAIEAGSGECLTSGTILREYWAAVPGAKIEHIPLDAEPTSTSELTIFEAPENIGTNYATRISGYICPPATGNYVFWIASNDHSELWLSTDDDPSNKIRVAYVMGATDPRQWNKFASQRSAPIMLEQGERYYIEGLHKQGVGTDHIAAGWQLPDGTLERPIPGSRLSPFTTETLRMPAFASGSMMQEGSPNIPDTGESNGNDLEIFPNPAKSGNPELVITGYKGAHGLESAIEIQHVTGEIVYVTQLTCQGNCKNYHVLVDQALSPGIYLVNIVTNGRRYSKRLLVK